MITVKCPFCSLPMTFEPVENKIYECDCCGAKSLYRFEMLTMVQDEEDRKMKRSLRKSYGNLSLPVETLMSNPFSE